MKSALHLFVAMVLQTLAPAALAAPPDAIRQSPVPPLKAPVARAASRTVIPRRTLLPPAPPATPFEAPSTPNQAPSSAADARPRPYEHQPPTTDDAESLAIWNSPEMEKARRLVMEFSRRAARTSPQEGEEFLRKLSRLPPREMEWWLTRFQERRMNVAVQRAVEEAARQLMLQRAISRQEAMRQAAANINDLRRQAAQTIRQRHAEQQWYSHELGAERMFEREAAAAARPQHPDDSEALDFVVDLLSPRGHKRRVAAAMSLPGDLPPSDPRNFIRGEAGVDIGEWANSRGAEPPVAGVSRSTPTAPIAEPAPTGGEQ